MRTLSQIILEQEKSKKQKEYDDFFESKLKEYGVKSPAELDDAEKKKFFNEIDKEWTGEGESTNEMAAPIEEDPGADVKGGLKGDTESQENGEGAGEEIPKEMGDSEKSADKVEDEINKMGEPKDGGDGEAAVTDDQKITSSVKEENEAEKEDEEETDEEEEEVEDDGESVEEKVDTLISSLDEATLAKLAERLKSL